MKRFFLREEPTYEMVWWLGFGGVVFFFQAEDGIRDDLVTGVQTCALPISSFANSAVANPRFAAAFVGTLIRGLGADHVVWGTDSLWYGSPQWQIEAMRRLEIPAAMQKKHGFAPLRAADGSTKTIIFAPNS